MSEEKWTQVHLWTECFCGGHLYRTALTRRQRSIFICGVRVITSFPLFKAAPTATFSICRRSCKLQSSFGHTVKALLRLSRCECYSERLTQSYERHFFHRFHQLTIIHHPSLFHSRLETFLFRKSFQPQPSSSSLLLLAVSRGKSGCKLPAKFFFVFLLLFGDKCSVFNSL